MVYFTMVLSVELLRTEHYPRHLKSRGGLSEIMVSYPDLLTPVVVALHWTWRKAGHVQ